MNPNCDNYNCTNQNKESRILPIGNNCTLILCKSCYEHEMEYRKKCITEHVQNYELPKWEDLEIYPIK